jgi:hypothetical protein
MDRGMITRPICTSVNVLVNLHTCSPESVKYGNLDVLSRKRAFVLYFLLIKLKQLDVDDTKFSILCYDSFHVLFKSNKFKNFPIWAPLCKQNQN